ncbi:MAG TPA: EF-hand domain-containing protein [Novosphingobium sp.]|nr:EF-hand domain-containing protein [Novosphingobium sp.]
MNSLKKVSLAISAAALAVGGIAYAQMREGHPQIDTNGDGVITRAEEQAAASAMFARLDVNKDGKLDQTDRDAHRQQMRSEMFARLDADNNGSISKDEFMNAQPSREGGPRGKHMSGPGGMGMGGTGDHRMHGRHGMGSGHGGGMMMKMADTNGDGSVSQTEFMAAADKHFAMADANRDGKVTKEEGDAARQKMKDAWKARKSQAPDHSM